MSVVQLSTNDVFEDYAYVSHVELMKFFHEEKISKPEIEFPYLIIISVIVVDIN